MLETLKPFSECSPEERDVVELIYGRGLPADAKVHMAGATLVIEELDLAKVTQVDSFDGVFIAAAREKK